MDEMIHLVINHFDIVVSSNLKAFEELNDHDIIPLIVMIYIHWGAWYLSIQRDIMMKSWHWYSFLNLIWLIIESWLSAIVCCVKWNMILGCLDFKRKAKVNWSILYNKIRSLLQIYTYISCTWNYNGIKTQ